MEEIKNEPIYLKTWFLITSAIVLLIVVCNVLPSNDVAQTKFSVSTYNNMTTEQQRNCLNDFVTERKSKLKMTSSGLGSMRGLR